MAPLTELVIFFAVDKHVYFVVVFWGYACNWCRMRRDGEGADLNSLAPACPHGLH